MMSAVTLSTLQNNCQTIHFRDLTILRATNIWTALNV